jgi:hypothetical protein
VDYVQKGSGFGHGLDERGINLHLLESGHLSFLTILNKIFEFQNFREMERKHWNDVQKLKLANLVLKQQAYKRTGEVMEKKWKLIAELLAADPDFANLKANLEWKNLRRHFARLQDLVLEEAGIDKPGANLSGLAEEPSPYVLMMINMAEEVSNLKGAKEVDNAKKKRLQENLLTHEGSILQQQVNIHYPVSVNPCPPTDVNAGEFDCRSSNLSEVVSPSARSSSTDSGDKSKKRKGHDFLQSFSVERLLEPLLDEES